MSDEDPALQDSEPVEEVTDAQRGREERPAFARIVDSTDDVYDSQC